MVSEGYYSLVLILFTIALLAGSFVYLFYHVKKPVKKESVKAPDLPGKIEMISMAALSDKEACSELEKVLSQVSSHFPEMSTLQQLELRSIRSECQEMVYSSISSEGKKEELKRRALVLLRQLKS